MQIGQYLLESSKHMFLSVFWLCSSWSESC